MDSWIYWLIAAVALTLGELTIMGFFLAPFAVGAIVALILDATTGTSTAWPWIGFAVASVVSFLVIRPVAQRHLTTPPEIRTGTAALVGHGATVVQDADNERNQGTARLDGGEIWTARPVDGGLPLPAGSRVQIVEIRGVTAIVVPDEAVQ